MKEWRVKNEDFCVSVEMGGLLGFAQTHFIFLSWYKKTKQKKIKAERTEPTRYVCSFAERRKLAYGSDSSTFFFAHFRTSGFASRHVMPFPFVLRTNLD